jgi:hypothetical protein
MGSSKGSSFALLATSLHAAKISLPVQPLLWAGAQEVHATVKSSNAKKRMSLIPNVSLKFANYCDDLLDLRLTGISVTDLEIHR